MTVAPLARPAESRLVRMLDWPQQVAVVQDRAASRTVLAALAALDIRPMLTSLRAPDTVLPAAAPYTFLVVSPEVFEHEDGVARMRTWQRHAPAARLILADRAAITDARVLTRALRAGVTDVIECAQPAKVHAAFRTGLRHWSGTGERVLAIGAHPDDVELGCAATLWEHRRRGARITVFTLSRGSVGADPRRRESESVAAAQALGARLLLADLPDTAIGDGIETIRLIEKVVRQVNPTVIYVHSQHDAHQDHRAVSAATCSAARRVRRIFGYQSPSATNEFRPTRFVNIDHAVGPKVDVLKLYASQQHRSYMDPDFVLAAARYWGRHLPPGARFAEPFEVIRTVDEPAHETATSPLTGAPALHVVGEGTAVAP